MTNKSAVIRAEIIEGRYHVGEHSAASLPALCVILLAAGYSGDAVVEGYRPGKSEWDIRARSIRAGAEARKAGEDDRGSDDSPRINERTGSASPARRGPIQKPKRGAA